LPDPTPAEVSARRRAGTQTALYTGPIEILGDANAPALEPIAWYRGNSSVDFDLENGQERTWLRDMQNPEGKAGTHPVKRKESNPWGLCDMLGNVSEWTQDAWHENSEGAPTDGSAWESDDVGTGPVLRGGSWLDHAGYCRSAYRSRDAPDYRNVDLGFRCARVQA